jgi:hypothetical protein
VEASLGVEAGRLLGAAASTRTRTVTGPQWVASAWSIRDSASGHR